MNDRVSREAATLGVRDRGIGHQVLNYPFSSEMPPAESDDTARIAALAAEIPPHPH